MDSLGDELPRKLFLLLPEYLVLLLSIVCHEAAHAWSAARLGDRTASEYISLNPLPHIRRSPFGMVVIPLICLLLSDFMIGFASVPVNVLWARMHPKKYALSSLAGPAANVALCLCALLAKLALLLIFGASAISEGGVESIPQGLYLIVDLVFFLNIILATFNLMPVPPLDGSHVPLLFIPKDSREAYTNIIWNPSMSLPGLLIAWLAFPSIFAKFVIPLSEFMHSAILFFIN